MVSLEDKIAATVAAQNPQIAAAQVALMVMLRTAVTTTRLVLEAPLVLMQAVGPRVAVTRPADSNNKHKFNHNPKHKEPRQRQHHQH